jgi:hypothetical protein
MKKFIAKFIFFFYFYGVQCGVSFIFIFYVDQVFWTKVQLFSETRASSLNRCLTFVSLSVQVPDKDQKCHVNLGISY